MQRDAALMIGIVQYGEAALRHVDDLSLEQFAESELRQYAAAHALMAIGEAASKVSGDLSEAHPEVPWRAIIGLRHRIVHDYMNINIRRVWETVKTDLPPLIATLRQSFPPEHP